MPVYYRGGLSRGELSVYDEIVAGISRWRTEIPVGRCDMESAMAMHSLVLLDNPELFHALPAVRARTMGRSTSLFPEYAFGQAEANMRWRVIDAHVYDYKSMLAPSAGDYEKVEKAYEYIIKLCEYGHSADDQNMCSVLVDEVSCCTGYSKAFAYLLSTVGVAAPVITGMSSSSTHGSGLHAWNAVCVDGRWSWCDATWGDPVAVSGDKRLSEVCYDFLCVPDSELAGSHSIDSWLGRFVPVCDDDSNSWHRKHHLLFSTYDEQAVAKALQGDVLGREIGFGKDFDGDAYLKFTSRSAYSQAVEKLCRQMEIRRILAPVYDAYGYSISGFSYSLNGEMLTIHIRYDILKNNRNQEGVCKWRSPWS